MIGIKKIATSPIINSYSNLIGVFSNADITILLALIILLD